MQKFFDQAISCNWSYNPLHFENNEVPLSVMMKDMLTTYKLGWKTSYYQNTYDFKGQEDDIQPAGLEDTKTEHSTVDKSVNGASINGTNGDHVNGSNGEKVPAEQEDEHCDACAI